jgi:hypothetical protein
VASYYFLGASLPMLRFDENAPMSDDTFMGLCKAQLSGQDYALLEHATLGKHEIGEHRFLIRWNSFFSTLQLLMATERAKKLGIDAEQYRPRYAYQLEATTALKQIVQAEDPLQSELELLRACWRVLDDMETNHMFDMVFLLSYRLKLQLLLRKDLFSPLEGNAEFKRLFSNLQTNIKSL